MLSVSLDLNTLILLLCGVSLLRASVMVHYATRRKTYDGFYTALTSEFLCLIGLVVSVIPQVVGPAIAVYGGNLGTFLYCALFHDAVYRYSNGPNVRQSRLCSGAIILVATVLLTWAQVVAPSALMRSVIHSGTFALLALRIACEIPLRGTRRLHGMRLVCYSFGLTGLLQLARVQWLLGLETFSFTIMMEQDMWFRYVLLYRILHAVIEVYAVFSMNSHLLEQDLQQAHAEVAQLAQTDPLTGALNRRGFMSLAEQALRLSQRYAKDASLILIDIDHFKRVNDAFGHPVGDRVLRTTASICRRSIRDVDVFGRLGGDEFVIFAPFTDVAEAEELAHRLRTALARELASEAENIPITASFGVAAGITAPLADLIAAGDVCLYTAKRSGRNTVVAASSLETQPGRSCPFTPEPLALFRMPQAATT